MALEFAMNNLLESSTGDVTIFSDDGKDIKVVKAIICNITDYFKAVLHNTTSLKAPVGYEGLKFILRHIYTLDFADIPDEMPIRERFKMIDTARLWLLKDLEHNIIMHFKNNENIDLIKLYRLADEFIVDELTEYTAHNIKRNIAGYCINCSNAIKVGHKCCKHSFKCATCSTTYCLCQTMYGEDKCCDKDDITDYASYKLDNSDAELSKLNEKQLRQLLSHLLD